MKKFIMFMGILLLLFIGFLVFDSYTFSIIPILDIEDSNIEIDKLYIYGTHLNMEGNYTLDSDSELVLYNGKFLSYKVNINDGKFNFSEYVNDGIYLDDIPKGKYYLFFRTKYVNEEGIEEYKYYPLKNNTKYKDTIYYTMSNYEKKIVISNEDSYPTMMMKIEKVKNDNVYDIVLDPGHGGRDGGANNKGYQETDFTLDIATKLIKKLEDEGFKVKLTHEIGELSSTKKLPEYGIHGRAVIPREVNAKYLFSIHLNSSSADYVNGLEVYTAKNINYDFAKLLVNNITMNTGIKYSKNKINKIYDSIYSRNFTDIEVKESIEDYIEDDFKPYDITTNSNYYYMIRETGGVITGAYVDNRNSDKMYNPYVDSNVGTETYLLELGYISNPSDLDNMVNNRDKFINAIYKSIKTLKDW